MASATLHLFVCTLRLLLFLLRHTLSVPVIACDLVIQLIDQLTGSYLVALDRTTGRVRWKRDRPGATIGYATPMVFRPSADRADIITIGSTRLDAYDLANGRLSVRTGEAVYCFTGPRLPEPSR